MLAGITRTDELALSSDEAESLAGALATVNQFYQVEVAEKTLAWINLAQVAGMIYGTRLVAIRQRRRAERADRVQQPDAADFPSTANGPAPLTPDFFNGPLPN